MPSFRESFFEFANGFPAPRRIPGIGITSWRRKSGDCTTGIALASARLLLLCPHRRRINARRLDVSVPGRPVRVLIVEDEHRMATYIARALAEEACAVDLARDGESGLERASASDFDAIVLDLMLPKLDGLTVCRRLRGIGKQTPVLMLSARDMIEDRVRGLDAGADDYLVKPFAIIELVARLRALHRRRHGSTPSLLASGPLTLDPATRAVERAGRPIVLTAREFALLEYFMRRTGAVLTRTMIAEHVWDFGFEHASNVVDVYVKHLRDKIDEPGGSSFIQAVRGVGYVFRHPDPAGS